MDAATLFPFFQHLAHESAKIIMPLFANPDLQVEWKADDTPVTYADKKAEEVLRRLISDEFPSHGVIGEEFGEENPDAEFTWVLDPIDGTRTFTAGSPHFGTLIALRHRGEPIWGAIHLPAIRQLYVGNNEGAWCNNREVRVRETPALADCFLVYTDPKGPYDRHSLAGWHALVGATGQARSWGDCFGYTLLASGGVDIMCDPIMNLWDIAALLPVLRGAGAAVSDWQGLTPAGADSLIACHPRHHATVLHLLNPS